MWRLSRRKTNVSDSRSTASSRCALRHSHFHHEVFHRGIGTQITFRRNCCSATSATSWTSGASCDLTTWRNTRHRRACAVVKIRAMHLLAAPRGNPLPRVRFPFDGAMCSSVGIDINVYGEKETGSCLVAAPSPSRCHAPLRPGEMIHGVQAAKNLVSQLASEKSRQRRVVRLADENHSYRPVWIIIALPLSQRILRVPSWVRHACPGNYYAPPTFNQLYRYWNRKLGAEGGLNPGLSYKI